MRFGSLFSGIGGLDLGLERAGMECRWQVEIDPWCRRVLAKHWPDVARYEDVRDVAHAEGLSSELRASAEERQGRPTGGSLEPVDLICGGFPCQPVSVAGKRLGELDERWLWPEFARIVRLLRPRFVLVENVPGLFHRGFGRVLGDLAEAGYDTEWFSLRASDVGAPHRRERVFIVAHASGTGAGMEAHTGEGRSRVRAAMPSEPAVLRRGDGALGSAGSHADSADVADADSGRLEQRDMVQRRLPVINAISDVADTFSERGRSRDSGRADAEDAGKPPGHTWGGQWDAEPDVGRVANGVPSRVDRLRGLGNAVVPQVAEWIGRRILEVDHAL